LGRDPQYSTNMTNILRFSVSFSYKIREKMLSVECFVCQNQPNIRKDAVDRDAVFLYCLYSSILFVVVAIVRCVAGSPVSFSRVRVVQDTKHDPMGEGLFSRIQP
jgi:hypothetical protein